MNTQGIMKEINKLSIAQRILLLEQAWDNLAKSPEEIPLSEWQKDELDKRLTEHNENPDMDNIDSAEVFKQLRTN
ncbi:MAG: addiction module protein [Gammaproteobacteria bacterium]|nr:addiction module protein [Gammaproteobacteria bacterium]